ncbi:MAG: hypothetical protein ACREA9_27810 [Pyrinomonadaceae bacterium]
MEKRGIGAVVYCAVAYLVIGVASALISNPVTARNIQALLRLAALFLGILVFVCHIRYEIIRLKRSRRTTAVRASIALAAGTFLLAVYAVLSAFVDTSHWDKSIALALIVWPLVTGFLGFLPAMVVAAIFAQWRKSQNAS